MFKKINTVFGYYDFISWKLSGVKVVEQNWSIEAGFVDSATGKINDELFARQIE